MIFKKTIAPSAPLQEFVRCYTVLHLKLPPAQVLPVKYRPPKPDQGLVFYIRGQVHLHNLVTWESQVPPAVALFSHQTQKHSYTISPEFYILRVVFQPGVLHRLTGVPALELGQEFHDAELFFGRSVRSVSEQLAEAAGPSALIEIIERFLQDRFHRVKMSSTVDEVANYLLADPSSFSLDAIARQACFSTKQFYRKFVERIGISPKLFSRMARFNQAYQYKIAHPNTTWSSIAQEFGYTDYHHLEKEFKEFSRLTPNEWIRENGAAPERILPPR